MCLVSACELQSGQIDSTIIEQDLDQLHSGFVTRVNDGDSIAVEIGAVEVEVRLLGINAPEEDECFYDEATDELTGLLEGRLVEVEDGGTDQFGRTLAYLWLEGSLVNLGLVSNGFAIATTPGEGETKGKDLLTAEDEAFSDRVGLWAIDACGVSGVLPDVIVDGPGSQFNPPGPDEQILDQEWVTFESEEDVDLGGWKVRDESSAHRCLLPPGTTLAPGQALTVTSADRCWDPVTPRFGTTPGTWCSCSTRRAA